MADDPDHAGNFAIDSNELYYALHDICLVIVCITILHLAEPRHRLRGILIATLTQTVCAVNLSRALTKGHRANIVEGGGLLRRVRIGKNKA